MCSRGPDRAHLILCGLPGSGKTTVGRLLAEKLQLPFIDLDQQIENKHGLSCREIVLQRGLEVFRQFEYEAFKTYADFKDRLVIATGGGIVDSPQSTTLLKELGFVIYLQAEVKELLLRVMRSGTPAYLDAKDPLGSFQKLAQRRVPFYNSHANLIIETSQVRSPEMIVKDIINIIN